MSYLLFLLCLTVPVYSRDEYYMFNLLDKFTVVTKDSFNCMFKDVEYTVFASRGYKTNGLLDIVGVQNMVNAQSVGFMVDAVIEPCTSCSAGGKAQAQTLLNYTNGQNITLRTVWIDFYGAIWVSGRTEPQNRQMVLDMGSIFEANNLTWGVKASADRWSWNVGNWTALSADNKQLWWPFGTGDYDILPEAYVPFGGWRYPNVHEFGNFFNKICAGIGSYYSNNGWQ